MRTGKVNIQGNLNLDSWQKIYELDNTLDYYTKLLLHCEGTDGSTTFTDEAGHSVTAVNNAQIDTAQYKFQTASALFDGAGDYIYLADSDDWNFGANNFTVDFWIRPNDLINTQNICGQCSPTGVSTYASFGISLVTAESMFKVQAWVFTSGMTQHFVAANIAIGSGWHHIALIRNGSYLRLYQDGILVGSNSWLGTDPLTNSPNQLSFGRYGEIDSSYFNGWLDEIRISKGIARWTANFTPPAEPYLPYAQTSITISGLDGDTDEEYMLICRLVNGATAATELKLRPNNDSGSNYGYQFLRAYSTTVEANRSTSYTGTFVNYANQNNLSFSETIIYAKSGYLRTMISKQSWSIIGTTVTDIVITGNSWNNTTDNITSLVIYADQTNGLGIGTVIELYRKIKKV